MPCEPSIVKQLRKEEKKGVLKENLDADYSSYETDEKDFFKLAVDNSLDSIFLIDRKKMVFIDVNKTACESTGYSRDELLNMGPQHIKPEFSKKQLSDKFDVVLNSSDGKGVIETVHKRKDGTTFPVEVFLSCLKDDNIIIAAVRDITDRKKAEEKIKKSEKEYRTLVESLNEGIWKIDKDSVTTFVNNRMAEMLGYSVDEMIGKHLFYFMDEKGKKIAKNNLKRREKGINEQHDFEFIRKDGKRIYTTLETSSIIDDGGLYQGAIAGVIDITDRRKNEEKLSESERELRDLFENANDLIQRVDANGNFRYVNKRWKEVMGYSDEEIRDLHFTDILKEEYVSHCIKIFKDLSKGKSFENVEVIFKTKSGEEIIVNGNLNSQIVDGRFISTRGIFRDVTEDKKMEKKLSEARNIINSSPIVAFTWRNVEGWPVEFVSENVEKIFGYSSKDFLSGNIHYEKCIHPDDLKRVSEEVERYSSDKKINNFEHKPYRIITKDGKIRYVSDKSFIIRNENKEVTYFKGLIEDITDKQKMMKEIVETKNKYTSLVEQSNDGIIIVQDKKFKFVNQALSKITGFSMNELTDMFFLDTVSDDEEEKLSERYKKRLKGEKVPDFYNTKIKCKNGDIKDVELSASIINYEDKPAILAFVRDISDRIKIEKKLRENEEKYRLLFNKSRDALMTIGPPSWKFKSANPATINLFNAKNEEEYLGKGPWDVSPKYQPDGTLSSEKAKKMIDIAMKEGSKFFEWTHKTLDGKEFPSTVLLNRVEIENEKTFLQATVRDISKQKEIENDLKKSENKFRVLFNSSSDAIFIHDPNDFSIIDVNQEACKRFGYTVDEMKKLNIYDISDSSMPSMHSKEAEQIIRKIMGGEIVTLEWLSKNRSKDLFWHEMKIKLIDIDGNKRIIATARDINKRKKAEEKLKEKLDELKKWKKVTVDRELKMKELKEKIKKIENQK